MDSVDQSLVFGLFNQGFSAEQISGQLHDLYPTLKGLSKRSVQRFLSENGCLRDDSLPAQEVDQVVSQAVAEIGHKAGRRYVKGFIDSQGGPAVSEHRVGEALKRIDPQNHHRRYTGLARQLNPVPYSANYFGHRLHMDQNEKLARHGVTIVAAIDGFSGFVTSAVCMPIKNNLVIYDKVFRKTVIQHGLWDQVVVDCGQEFSLTLSVQRSWRNLRNDLSGPPYMQITSTKNNRIERFWVEVNDRIGYPIKVALNEMENEGKLDLTNQGHRFCCSERHRQW